MIGVYFIIVFIYVYNSMLHTRTMQSLHYRQTKKYAADYGPWANLLNIKLFFYHTQNYINASKVAIGVNKGMFSVKCKCKIVYITHKGFSDILLKPCENIPDVYEY